MARIATDAFVHVNAVVEINEIRKVVDPRPHQRVAAAKAGADRLKHGRVRPDLRMAVHACFSRRNAGEAGSLYRGMAVAATQSEPAHAVMMAEGNRLQLR